ncbi:NUDIX domain-containing protein [Candidatus Pacearchaeota archaeon]|nr:NUDIX domain-containing protein [Candidatus Pacearchaeota archaeon]
MEKAILKLFLNNHRMKFSDIEKFLKIRSNKLAYHIKSLIKKGMLEKNENFYKLPDSKEYLIPYLTNKKSVLPVILIAIKNSDGIFLVERNKRPFKGKFGLPGGRIILGETVPKATERIMKKKFGAECKFKKINSISMEFVKNGERTIHSFLLIFVTAETKEKIKCIDFEKNRSRIISSDYYLIKNDIGRKIRLNNLITKS